MAGGAEDGRSDELAALGQNIFGMASVVSGRMVELAKISVAGARTLWAFPRSSVVRKSIVTSSKLQFRGHFQQLH